MVDLIQYKQPPKDVQYIPMEVFTTMHNHRWVLKLSCGDLVLRKIRYVDYEMLTERMKILHPEYSDYSAEMAQLRLKEKLGGLTAKEMDRLNELSVLLIPKQYEIAALCIEHPMIKDGNDLGIFLSALRKDERTEVYTALTLMQIPMYSGVLDTAMLEILKNYGIVEMPKLADITQEQVALLLEAQSKNIEKMNALMEKAHNG